MERGTRSDHKLDALGRRASFPLDELPVNVLTVVLSKTTPRDVCRLAAVNKCFAEAASSDLLWKEFLPADIEEILQTVQGGVPPSRSVKDLCNHLTNHLVLADGTAGYFLDRDTGDVCRTFSARTLHIEHGDESSHWNWLPYEESRFREVAFLKSAHWLNLSGEINCRLPRGAYTLSWVLKFERGKIYGWNSYTLLHGGTVVSENSAPRKPCFAKYTSHRGSRRPLEGRHSLATQWLRKEGRDPHQWWEYNFADFTVTSADDVDNVRGMRLKFSKVLYVTHLNALTGLYVDGVILRSKSTGH